MDIFLGPEALADERPDPADFLAAGEVDAASDAQWFDDHPGQTVYIRDPSPLEIRKFNLPPSAKAVVARLPDGTQLRGFTSKAD